MRQQIFLPSGTIFKNERKASTKLKKHTPEKVSKPRGRPSEFNHEVALEAALNVFWAQGYEGTSMADLTEALGINKPSIYAAFDNKEALFKKALSKYAQQHVRVLPEALNAPTAKQAIETFFTQAATLLTNPSTPKGCLIVQGALACSEDAGAIHQLLADHRASLETAFAKRFELAKQQGELRADANSTALAKLVTTVHQGMSVQAKSGASKEALLAMTRLLLQSNVFG